MEVKEILENCLHDTFWKNIQNNKLLSRAFINEVEDKAEKLQQKLPEIKSEEDIRQQIAKRLKKIPFTNGSGLYISKPSRLKDLALDCIYVRWELPEEENLPFTRITTCPSKSGKVQSIYIPNIEGMIEPKLQGKIWICYAEVLKTAVIDTYRKYEQYFTEHVLYKIRQKEACLDLIRKIISTKIPEITISQQIVVQDDKFILNCYQEKLSIRKIIEVLDPSIADELAADIQDLLRLHNKGWTGFLSTKTGV